MQTTMIKPTEKELVEEMKKLIKSISESEKSAMLGMIYGAKLGISLSKKTE